MLSAEPKGPYVAQRQEVEQTFGTLVRSRIGAHERRSATIHLQMKKLPTPMSPRRSEHPRNAASVSSAKRTSAEERRVQPRFTAQFRGSFSGTRGESQGRTLDISSGGCKIESDMTVVAGDVFECRLHIPGLDWPLRIDEVTVRWVEGRTCGIAFTRMRTEETAKLRTVLTELHQDA